MPAVIMPERFNSTSAPRVGSSATGGNLQSCTNPECEATFQRFIAQQHATAKELERWKALAEEYGDLAEEQAHLLQRAEELLTMTRTVVGAVAEKLATMKDRAKEEKWT